MRIAFLTSEYGDFGSERGGLGYYLARTAPLVAARGHDCEVFLCSGASDEEAGTFDHGRVRVQRLAAGPTPFDGLRHPPQVRHHLRSAWALAGGLAEAHRHTRFDVVQVPNYGISGLFADVAAPVVMRFSSHAPTWHDAAGVPRNLRVTFSELLQGRAIGRADRHYAPSRFVAELVQAETGWAVDVLRPPAPPGPSLDGRDEAWAREVTGGADYLLHAGQLGRAKGTDLVLEAASAVLDRRTDLHLHLCGRDAGAGDAIRSLQERWPDRVQCHGQVSLERLHSLMAGAMAVVAPSRADNLPNVVIEAMSLGAAVVGVKGASIDELVVDGESGYLAAPEDARSLASAIDRIVALPGPARESLGSRARSQIRALLAEEQTIDALVSYYESAARLSVDPRLSRDRMAIGVRLRLAATGYPIKARNALVAMRRRIGGRSR